MVEDLHFSILPGHNKHQKTILGPWSWFSLPCSASVCFWSSLYSHGSLSGSRSCVTETCFISRGALLETFRLGLQEARDCSDLPPVELRGGDDLFFPKSPPPSLVRKPEWRVSLWHYKLHLSDSRHSGKSSQSCCRDDLRLYGENNLWNYTFAYFPHGLWSSQGSRVERVWQLKINKSRTKSLIDQSQEVNQELNKRIRIHTFRFTLSIGWPGWLFRERMGATDFCIPELVWV